MPYIDWMGKDDVKDHHKNIEYKTIECKESIGDIDSQNMIIKGDNLLALKSLLPYYASSVKMIYIDPPYNTGNTSWVYNDNMDSPLIKKWLNDTVNADDLSRSDKWLCMMWPRLKLLRELLKDDGVIFISIDDAEVTHLRMICDEIFGRNNFITSVCWQGLDTIKNDAKYFSNNHEYVLVYAKNKVNAKIKGQKRTNEHNKVYKNHDNDPKGNYLLTPLNAKSGTENGIYTYTFKNNTTWTSPKGTYPRFSKSKLKELEYNNMIYFGKKENTIPQKKTYLCDMDEYIKLTTFWSYKFAGSTRQSNGQLSDILSKGIFQNPKPKKLLEIIINSITSKNDIILDSFAGSGTTAHAVLEQNKEDGGSRKFILIETLDYAKDITAERVKRVIKGYDFIGKDKTTLYEKKLTTSQVLKPETMDKISYEVNKTVEYEKQNYTKIEKTFKENTIKVTGIKDIKTFKDGIGGGFKYCELSHNIFDEFGELNSKLTFDQIAKHIYFVEFKKPVNKKTINAPFVGTYKNQHIYFYEKKFLNKDLKDLLIKHRKTKKEYKQLIIYTAKSTVSNDTLKEKNIIIRYIPYDIKDN
ncbi:MAG: site-specific DNA-methyltransferase [Epsilonproteobacteria bacterium]|nr:MAG: site-specific DNA-methyltransferase [Campylobacterota bacterium]